MIKAKRIVKTAAGLVMGLAITLSLTACGGSSDNQATDSKEGTESSDTANESGSSESGEKTTVRYAVMSGSSTHWFAVLGREKGIWDKYGIDIQITEFANGIETVDSVSTGQADIGFVTDFAGLNRFGNTQGKTDLKFFEEQSKISSYALYVNPEKIKKIEDLKGARVMVMLGTFLEYLDAKTLEKAGLNKDDIEVVPVDSPATSLSMAQTDQADAMWTTGDEAKKLMSVGWQPIMKQSDIGVNTYVFHVASESYLKDNQDTVINFIKAYEEIYDYMINNGDDAAKTISEQIGIGEDLFANGIKAMEVKAEFTEDAVKGLQEIDTWAVDNGFYSPSVDVHDFINTDALKAVHPENVTIQ